MKAIPNYPGYFVTEAGKIFSTRGHYGTTCWRLE